jgi:hypothetical protein
METLMSRYEDFGGTNVRSSILGRSTIPSIEPFKDGPIFLEADDLTTVSSSVSFEVSERRTEPPDLALAYILSSPSISILFYLVLWRA